MLQTLLNNLSLRVQYRQDIAFGEELFKAFQEDSFSHLPLRDQQLYIVVLGS
jgi:hypothetical protein